MITNYEKFCGCFTPSSFGGYKEGVGTLTASGGGLGGGSENLVATAYNITFNDVNGIRKDRPNGGMYVNETNTSRALTNSDCDTKIISQEGMKLRIRKLTPIECERLQGFPDNYTNIPWNKRHHAPDSLRYKAIGNSMAVVCMKYIAKLIYFSLYGAGQNEIQKTP